MSCAELTLKERLPRRGLTPDAPAEQPSPSATAPIARSSAKRVRSTLQLLYPRCRAAVLS